MENKQTAVECLKEKLMYLDFHPNTLVDVLQWIEQAKQMEKEQIVKAWNDGDHAYFYSKETGKDFENGEQYYKETYGK
jgi:hypothetical protein